MKRLILLLSLCAWSACAQQNLTVTFNLTAEQWDTLTNKVAVVNAELATKHAADMVTWEAAASAARVLRQPEPPHPVLVVLTAEQYVQRFATAQLGSTKAELRAAREGSVVERIRTLSPAKLRQLEEFAKTLQ